MPQPRNAWTDQKVEEIVGNLLRAGLIAAAVVVPAGRIPYLIQSGATSPHYGVFHGEPADLRQLSAIVSGALALRSRALIQFGLLLIATPVARVVFAVFAFARQYDRTYVIVALILLAVLLFSLAGGVCSRARWRDRNNASKGGLMEADTHVGLRR